MKYITRKLLAWFDLRDKDVILREFRTSWWFLSAWVVSPEYGRGWRVRFAFVELLRQLFISRCTRCGSAFSLKELLKRPSELTYFQSGSICHVDCQPSEHFKEACRKMSLTYSGGTQ